MSFGVVSTRAFLDRSTSTHRPQFRYWQSLVVEFTAPERYVSFQARFPFRVCSQDEEPRAIDGKTVLIPLDQVCEAIVCRNHCDDQRPKGRQHGKRCFHTCSFRLSELVCVFQKCVNNTPLPLIYARDHRHIIAPLGAMDRERIQILPRGECRSINTSSNQRIKSMLPSAVSHFFPRRNRLRVPVMVAMLQVFGLECGEDGELAEAHCSEPAKQQRTSDPAMYVRCGAYRPSLQCLKQPMWRHGS